ncbi:tyrosine-type recombinase/integrase [Streptomyces orinoci]|uniref:tyrosine-type recombinase/integrase n=1 Tax=Streptomyces orinoci TaxID=67339 RepID=UPI003BA905FA
MPPRADDTRRTFRRSGYDSMATAQADLDKVRALLGIPGKDDAEDRTRIGDLLESVSASKAPIPDYEETKRKLYAGQSLISKLTVGEWLDSWLANKHGRPTAIACNENDIRLHLKPHIGHVPLNRLRVDHLVAMFNAIVERNMEIEENNTQRRAVVEALAGTPWKGRDNRARRKALKETLAQMPPFRRPAGAATRQRTRATLRAALNDAIAQQLITFNPAASVKLDPGKRPKALVWTAERIEQWRRTGEKPSPVMVWTPEQTGQFLDFVAEDRLYALWHLIAFRGLRRGEACGQGWDDTDLDQAVLAVSKQLVQRGREVYEDTPKTDSGARTVALDEDTVRVLKAHRKRQNRERLEWGEAWVNTGRIFTRENGEWLRPDAVTARFEKLVAMSGLPPIRLHDLRHGAATIALAAGTEMKVVQEMLGHSSITITSDTYTSVLPQVAKDAAEAAARLVPRARREGVRGTGGLTPGAPAGQRFGPVPAQPTPITKKAQVSV